ncbi:MAG: flagellar biosynthesis anti-sigma factor FlgM [Alphaproteobacteria bacterium HGW-Alphaproteobacteria-7]|jgi:negative regulator of flagellin synthesis FlgM|nr:MAG: flagellar biosynthesis anti-sigma factor FlgM [Alphaproteobacteria bacterium HGW-Alphaproteobacteria-7]
MPSVELSKLPGINPVRALATGDHAQIEARAPTANPGKAPVAGISVEVSAAADAATPPVDAERVQEIRNALRDGSYPLVPAKIADAMIAAQVSLSLPDRN